MRPGGELGREGGGAMQEGDGADFPLPIDGGSIKLARTEILYERAGDFYMKIQDAALWTAVAVWNGRYGGIRTPMGDGEHRVIYDPSKAYDWKEWEHRPSAVLVNKPPGQPEKPFTMYMGDAHIGGSIDFPEHTLIALVWVDDRTLAVFSENE